MLFGRLIMELIRAYREYRKAKRRQRLVFLRQETERTREGTVAVAAEPLDSSREMRTQESCGNTRQSTMTNHGSVASMSGASSSTRARQGLQDLTLLQSELTRLDDFTLLDAKALMVRVEAKEAQRKQIGSDRKFLRGTTFDDTLVTKRDLATLRFKIQALDTKIQLLLDVMSFDRFMNLFQNPENAEAARDLRMDLISEGVTDNPEQWLVDCEKELQARLMLATTWQSSEPMKSKD